MMTINCTKKLAHRLPFSLTSEPSPSTNVLGPWCANTFNIGRLPCIIVTNERSLLTVLLTFKEIRTFQARFLLAFKKLMQSLQLAQHQIDEELSEMQVIQFGQNTNRRTLGSMNDVVRMTFGGFGVNPEESLEKMSIALLRVPCGPLKMNSPAEAIAEIFRLPRGG